MKDSYIIGLNVSNHDSSACLLKNGEIISFIEQERISRNKIALGEAPIDALKVCLEKENISLEDVEAIGVGMDWSYRKEQYKEPETESDKYLQRLMAATDSTHLKPTMNFAFCHFDFAIIQKSGFLKIWFPE